MLLKKLKKIPVLQITALILVITFAIIMGGCPDDNVVPPPFRSH